MNDQRINDLVRMAMEVEELESSLDAEAATSLRLVGAGQVRRTSHRAWWISAGAAAAAGLAIAFILPTLQRPTPQPSHHNDLVFHDTNAIPATEDSGTEIGSPPRDVIQSVTLTVCSPVENAAYPELTEASARLDPESVEGSAVVAIYRDQRGSAMCVNVQPHEWSGNKCLSEVSAQEIRSVTVDKPCSPTKQTLMVALAGPRRELPQNDSQAMRLATCILGSKHDCDGDNRCLSHVAMQCVPRDVSVKIESVADSR